MTELVYSQEDLQLEISLENIGWMLTKILYDNTAKLALKIIDENPFKKPFVETALEGFNIGELSLDELAEELLYLNTPWVGEASNYNCSEDW